jgi:hypothetical protein
MLMKCDRCLWIGPHDHLDNGTCPTCYSAQVHPWNINHEQS